MRMFKKKTTIDFLGPGRRKIALIISALAILVSFVSLGVRGLEFGIDFTGGILLEVGYSEPADLDSIRDNLIAAGFEDAQVQLFGAESDVLVRLPPQGDGDQQQIRLKLQETLATGGHSVDLRRV